VFFEQIGPLPKRGKWITLHSTHSNQLGKMLDAIFVCVCIVFVGAALEVEATRNEGLLFIKPHAFNGAVSRLVKHKIAESGIDIISEGVITAKTIASHSHIDSHYGVIANRAFNMEPRELNVQREHRSNFKKFTGMDWEDAISRGLVHNAKSALAILHLDYTSLDSKWSKLKIGVDLIKLGSGFYLGRISGHYVINGFYLAMRQEYIAPGAAIQYFQVRWPVNESGGMRWSDFRSELLGSTDPASAPDESIRRKIYNNYKSLGLHTLPHTGTNGVHASASPLEGLVERMNWLRADVSHDSFGAALLAAGIHEGTIKYWSKDPVVEFKGKRQSVFDLVEDMDAPACLSVLVALGGRDDAVCTCKSIVQCGFFAWKSISDHTLESRKNQCSSQALECAGHFEKSLKSVSDHSLAARKKKSYDTSMVRCGHIVQRPWQKTVLPDNCRPKCPSNETAVVCAGHFMRAFRSLSEPTLDQLTHTFVADEPRCLSEECRQRAISNISDMLSALSREDWHDDEDIVWGEEDPGVGQSDFASLGTAHATSGEDEAEAASTSTTKSSRHRVSAHTQQSTVRRHQGLQLHIQAAILKTENSAVIV
jgi:nucleoside diphosphate kinase